MSLMIMKGTIWLMIMLMIMGHSGTNGFTLVISTRKTMPGNRRGSNMKNYLGDIIV